MYEVCPVCAANSGGSGGVGPAGPPGADGADGVDGADGAPGIDGVDGTSILIQGAVETWADLPATAAPGDCYVNEADGLLYDFDGAGWPPEGMGVPWRGQQGIQGVPGAVGPAGLGITYKGTVAVEGDLAGVTAPAAGDLYIVSEPAPAHGFVWDAEVSAWVDAGPVQGPQGVPGEQGIPGIAGPPGADGADGAVGPAGPIIPATATVLGGVKIGSGITVTADGTISSSGGGTGFLPTTGGEMTGAIVLPSGITAMSVKGTGYNLLGGSGGVAFRNNNTNILNHTATEVVAYVPITTSGTGIGVRFGSGGPSLSKSGTVIAASAPITVAAAPANPTELANKAYVDAAAGGGVANPVAGSRAGLTLWTGTQAEYDAIATKDNNTVYAVI